MPEMSSSLKCTQNGLKFFCLKTFLSESANFDSGPAKVRISGFGSQLQNPPQHGQWEIKSEKEPSPLLSSFPDFLSNKSLCAWARLFDSEESRKPGNETGKPIAKRLNTGDEQIKSKKAL
jgi:hypothetical protein